MSCGFDLADTCDIALAVGEACNNAAEHGHVERGSFSLGCSFDGRNLTVQVSDSGEGFDPAGTGTLRGEPAVRGLGIFIMRALMDSVSYRTNGRGTTVELIKHLNGSITAR